jgi:hypothetical protein
MFSTRLVAGNLLAVQKKAEVLVQQVLEAPVLHHHVLHVLPNVGDAVQQTIWIIRIKEIKN